MTSIKTGSSNVTRLWTAWPLSPLICIPAEDVAQLGAVLS